MTPLRIAILTCAAIVSGSFVPAPACADSWMPPTTQTYTACGGGARVIVTPRGLDDQLGYFEDKAGGVEPAGQARRGARFASARVERLIGGRWRPVRRYRLANDVAPVDAIVRDDGAYLVTFDDWHALGYGPNVVVVYGPTGDIVRALSLAELVSAAYAGALPRSVSSIHWRGRPGFSADGRRVLIPVVVPSEAYEPEPATAVLALTLADGSVAPVDPAAWDRALATGRAVRARHVAAEATAKAAFLAPLRGPRDNIQEAWHVYLREAVARLAGGEVTPSTTVLRLPGAADYAESAGWVHDALTDRYADAVALASLSQPHLAAVLAAETARLRPGALSKLTVYAAVSDRRWPAVRAAMARSGATLVQLAPERPIPQRADRIAQRYAD